MIEAPSQLRRPMCRMLLWLSPAMAIWPRSGFSQRTPSVEVA